MTASEQEFTAFVTQAFPRLLRTAFLLTGDRQLAEDLVQTVLAKMYLRWDALADVRGRDAMTAYARTAAVRQATSWWRRAWRRERPSDLSVHGDGRAGRATDLPGWDDDLASRAAERDRMMRLLAQLPSRQRAAVVLRYYDDLPEADIAAALGCSAGAVKTHLHRGLNRLRELVAAERAHEERGAER